MPDLPIPLVTGYYRYTDIIFEWHKTVDDPAEVSALKAFLSTSALGSDEHPFRQESKKGLQLFIVTLPSGVQRLTFSSKQVEYCRYWLHAMGFTKELLPIPSSHYLLTEENVSAVYYDSPEEIKKATRMIDKNNKKLKGTDSSLNSIRQTFDKVQKFYSSENGTWLAIDLEAYEMNHAIITEFGYSWLRWEGGNEVTETGHYIVKENKFYTNGRYVADNRDNFKFGISKVLTKQELKEETQNLIKRFQEAGPLYLVFHDASQDLEALKKSSYFDLPLDGAVAFPPSNVPDQGTYIIDTTQLFCALQGNAGEKCGLERMCRLLKLEPRYMHNAGNDAHYTLLALKSMAGGNQLDVQREERWPNQTASSILTGPTVKVIHTS